MQCSGIGNALNALASLAIPYGIGLPLVLSMRGTLGEGNPSQVPMGRATPAVLDALGIQAFRLRSPADVKDVTSGVLSLAYEAQACAAILLEPELGGGRERG
jgi:sulfopyruvate decarboxylase TPP-binding subunit